MKQKHLLTKMMLLTAVVLMGAGTAWAGDEVVYTLDGTITDGTNAYAEASEITQNEMNWSVVGNTTTNPWRIGGKSLDKVDRDIKGTTAFSEAITKITFNHAGTTSDNLIVNSVKLTVASDANFATVIDVVTLTPTISKNTNGSFDYIPTSPLTEWSTGSYYKFTINISNSKSSNYGFCPTSIVFYTESSKTATITAIDATGLTNTNLFTGTAAGQLTATVTAGGTTLTNAAITWTSSVPSVATVDESGNVTLVAAGTTDIKATYAGDDNYLGSEATYELTVENNDPSNLKATFDFSANKYNWVSTSDGSTYFDGSGYNATEGDITIGFSGKVRLWESSGSYTMRFYSDDTYGRGKMTLTAADGYVITGVSISGTTLSFQNPSSGTINGGEWTGSAQVLTIEKGSSTSNFNKVEVSYKQGIILPTPTVTIDATGITNTDVYTGTVAGSLAATVTYNDAAVTGATVTWSGDKDEVATIGAATGAVTLVAAGSVTFTATFAGNDDYNKATATYKMTVTSSDPNVPGTENNPYTVAQAITEIKAGNTGSYYVSGIISKISSTSVLSGGKLTYFISDDGTTTNQLQVYHGKNINDTEFTSVDDIALGDEVVVYGPFTYYNSNTPELNDGNYLVSLNRPVVASITVDPATVNVSAELQEGTLALTYNNLTITDMDDFDIQYYDADGKEIDEPEWIVTDVAEQDPQIGEGYVVSYVIATNRDDARTAYFKVFALGDTDYVYSNLITINQAKYVQTTNYTLATEIVSGKHYIIVGQKDGTYKAAGKQNQNNRAAVAVDLNEGVISVTSNDVYEFVIYGPNAQGYYTIYDEKEKGYLYAAQGNGTGNYMKTEGKLDADGNGIWSISISNEGVATIIATNENIDRRTMRYNSGSSCFSCYSSGQQNIYLYEKDGEATPTETITVTDAKYATYYSENALDFEGTGMTAYVADQKGTSLTFEPVTKVPAYTGVLVKANAAGDYTVPATSSFDGAKGSDLKGVIVETKITGAGIYVLMNGDEGVGFYKTTSAEFTIGAHTAYLPKITGLSRTFIGLDEATAIEGVAAEKVNNGEVYNLQGQRVTKAQKGLYIMNGKKVLVK